MKYDKFEDLRVGNIVESYDSDTHEFLFKEIILNYDYIEGCFYGIYIGTVDFGDISKTAPLDTRSFKFKIVGNVDPKVFGVLFDEI